MHMHTAAPKGYAAGSSSDPPLLPCTHLDPVQLRPEHNVRLYCAGGDGYVDLDPVQLRPEHNVRLYCAGGDGYVEGLDIANAATAIASLPFCPNVITLGAGRA